MFYDNITLQGHEFKVSYLIALINCIAIYFSTNVSMQIKIKKIWQLYADNNKENIVIIW